MPGSVRATMRTENVSTSIRADGGLRHAGDRDPDHIAEAVLALGGDEESGPDVLDKPLQAEPQRRAEQGGGRHQAPRGDDRLPGQGWVGRMVRLSSKDDGVVSAG